MDCYGVARLLTFNGKDLKGFSIARRSCFGVMSGMSGSRARHPT
jgi:hypothetical protein